MSIGTKVVSNRKTTEQVIESRRKPIVIGIGELLWDTLPSGKKAGGAPINFIYHAPCLGAEGYAINAVGDDKLGKEIADELGENHIQRLIERMPYPAGTIQVELREGIPTYMTHERVARDHISSTSDAVDLVGKADAICFGALTQRSRQSRETAQAISLFTPKDAYRLLNVNLHQRHYDKGLTEGSLYLANMLKMNDEELNVLRDLFGLDGTEREVTLWFVKRYGLWVFVLTMGSSHSTTYTREEISTLPTPEVMVADTVGTGDAFSGALVISLLRGKSLSETHHFAVKTAAFICTKEGTRPVYEE